MRSRRLALSGLLCALAVVVMILASAIGIGTFAGPVLAMAVLLPVREEFGTKAAAAVYAVTAVLGFLLVSEAELAFVYAAFGWYPIIQPRLNRIPMRVVRWACKLVLCTGVILTLYGVLLRVLGMSADLTGSAPVWNLLLVILGNVTFLLFDLALMRLSTLWSRKLRKRFFR